MSDINRRTELKTLNERVANWVAENVGGAILDQNPHSKCSIAGIGIVTLNL